MQEKTGVDYDTLTLVRSMAQKGLPEYCLAVDKNYTLAWFHYEIAWRLEEFLEQVRRGESPRLMICMPPRHGKSELATQKFPAWALGKYPELEFIVSSYSSDLAIDFGQNTRDAMQSDEYKNIFATRLRLDTTAKGKWMTEERGGYTATGVGGSLTGRGFNIGIVDDPFKNRQEADSETTREAVWKWYTSTFLTREEGNGGIIVILTRWHDDDLAGRILEKGEQDPLADQFELMVYPAIAEEDEEFRQKGEALWEAKYSIKKLLQRKASIGTSEFGALYQQDPIDQENATFNKGWFQHKTMDEVNKMFTRKYVTIDPQFLRPEKQKKSDHTGVIRNYVDTNNTWHIRAERHKLNSKGLIDLIFKLHKEGFEEIGVESSAYTEAIAPFMEDEMRKRGEFPNVVELKHGGIKKEIRIKGLTPRYETGTVVHIEGYDCEALEGELLRFPKSKYDDLSDAEAYQLGMAERADEEGQDETTEDDEPRNDYINV